VDNTNPSSQPPYPPYRQPPSTTQPDYPYPQPLPSPRPPKKSHRTLWIVLGSIGGVLIACCVLVGVAAALSPNSGNSANGSPTATSGPTATPPPPTATTDPQLAKAASYTAAVLPPMQTLSNDLDQMSTDCGNEDIVACRTDLEHIITDSTSFQTTLNQNPPPACLKSVDKQIRVGVIDYKNGA
jgi:hypothetical protein